MLRGTPHQSYGSVVQNWGPRGSRTQQRRFSMAQAARSYHHGSLRSALLDAAQGLVADQGLARFSMREVARKVGVSHAAPSHHFGDASGLLQALAVRGFSMLKQQITEQKQMAVQATGVSGPEAELYAATLAYVDFAEENPSLFRLMYRPQAEPCNTTLEPASNAVFAEFARPIEQMRGRSPYTNQDAATDGISTLCLVHGIADLLIAGRLSPLAGSARAERARLVYNLLTRDPPLKQPKPQGLSVVSNT